MAAVGLLYAASVVWGRALVIPPSRVSAVWPPAGVALAIFLIAGRRVWPVFWLAHFAAESALRADTTSLRSTLVSLGTFAGIATGSTFAAWAGAAAVRRFTDPTRLFKSFPSALRFIIFGGLLSSACAATFGVWSLAAGDFVPWSQFAYSWLTWWWGDVVGVIVCAPLILVWRDHLSSATPRPRLRALLTPANLSILGLCVGATLGVFSFSRVFFPFLLVPFFIVVAYRLGDLGSVTMVPLIVLIAGWSTAHGSGPFTNLPRDVAPLQLGAFYVSLAVTGLLLSAVLTNRRQAEDALRSNQRLLQAIIDTSPANIYVKDPEGRHLLVNRGCETTLGRPRAEILGKSDAELFRKEVADTLEADDREAWRAGALVEREETIVQGDDPRIYISHKFPLLDEQGAPYALCGISTDITDRLAERRAANAKLEESVSLLHATIESTADGLLVIDRAGSVVMANRKFQELWGIPDALMATGSDEELIGHVVALLKDPVAFLAKLEELYSQLEATSFDVIDLADGRIFERYSQPERVGDQIRGRVWSFRDVTERRRAEDQERRARAEAEDATRQAAFLAEASAILAESLDYATTLAKVARLALPAVADWCTVDLLETPGIRRVAAAHVDAAKEPLLRELREGLEIGLDSSMPAAVAIRTVQPYLLAELSDELMADLDQNPRRVEIISALGNRSLLAVPLRVRGRCIGAFTFHSATAGRYGSGDLPLTRELAGRCAMAIENAQLYADAQKSIQVRDDFISIASHELRTPLTPLKMQLDILRNHLRSDALVPSPKRDRLLALLESSDRQMNRLSQLVENLLDVSRVSADRLELSLEEVDLSQLARDVAEQLSDELARAGCATRVVAGAPVLGRWDRLRIEQVVTNLLTNAAKFGRGKPIEVRVSAEGGRARLAVQDHGPGVAEADQSRIFGRFERAAPINSCEGMGLGLYITRQIVLGHGGTIRVESQLNAGATFIVELPFTSDEPARS